MGGGVIAKRLLQPLMGGVWRDRYFCSGLEIGVVSVAARLRRRVPPPPHEWIRDAC